MRNCRKTAKILTAVISAAVLSAALSLSSAAAGFHEPKNKKGILISSQESSMLQDLSDLGVGQVICNIATDQNINAYDPLANYCGSHDITMTMGVINRAGAPADMIPTNETASYGDTWGTYGFNVLTESGKSAVRNYARSLANHYSNSVSNWVIGNEVNDTVSWDLNGITDIDAHADTYAEAFRIFYEEIRSANPSARVYIPFTMCWNASDGTPGRYTVKDYLPRLNERLRDLDYGIAWHAYPVHFFTRPEFLDDDGISNDINTTPNINLSNISLLTDYLQRDDMRDPSGNVRHLLLTEQGFTSACENGEERQAEAIRAAYEIVQANPLIEGFYLTRQVDAASQEAAGGAFGLWTRNGNASQDEVAERKKKAWYTYQGL